MKRIASIVVVVLLACYGYSRYQSYSHRADPNESMPFAGDLTARDAQPSAFSCDGRTRCSQMRSCEEATYFLKHCPGVEMDGDSDGIPCERQFCQ